MNLGRIRIGQFEYDGIHFDVVCAKWQEAAVMWMFQLFEGVGTWESPNASGDVMAGTNESKKYNTATEQVVKQVIEPANTYLRNRFGGGVVVPPNEPMGWIEQLDAVVDKIVFFLDAQGVPQIGL